MIDKKEEMIDEKEAMERRAFIVRKLIKAQLDALKKQQEESEENKNEN